MSTFVLKREYALQLPNNYVEIDRDEMEYVDGGGISDFLMDGAVNLLWGLVGSALWEYRSQISKGMVRAAVYSIGWVKSAVISAAGWVVANPGISLAILAGVVGGVTGYILARYL